MASPAVSHKGAVPLILVVDDEPGMLRYLRTMLEAERYHVETASCAQEALQRLQRAPLPHLVLMDVVMPDMGGMQALEQAREMHPTLKVVMLSCLNDTRKAAQAVRLGALDYLSKPFEDRELETAIRRCLSPTPTSHPEDASPQIVELNEHVSFVCSCPAMQRIHSQATQIAQFDMPVLLLGESGTGKEVVSLLIHQLSPRAKFPFLKINCAAVPADLLESELFGYEVGAFTGATKSKPGKFEMCDKGTILLDEIGEMPAALQAKLLQVLQDKTFSRLGSRTTVKVDVRILAATNINVQAAMASKALREDLFFRLSGFTMQIPPLRERKKEIAFLMKHFMNRMADSYARPPLPFSPRLLQACLQYSWPGNLRQLENFVKRYLVLADEDLAIAELQPEKAVQSGDEENAGGTGLKSLARSVKKEAEAEAIAHTLEQTHWHRGKAAVLLKISYKALLYKIREYGLHPPED
jgi:two-component system, NtrC family, response regulator AtoC